ncbi:MAG: spore protease YyaC [bacterium]
MKRPTRSYIDPRVHISDEFEIAVDSMTKSIYKQIKEAGYKNDKELIILCIGTDRATGDALGPLIGTELFKNKVNCTVIGNIDEPCHSQNLNEIIDNINEKYNDRFIVAIDAALGKQSSIGFIEVSNGPISPGNGVGKNLPEVGDISIVGVVNFSGYMELEVMRSTRLSVVMKMSNIISQSLINVINDLKYNDYQEIL